VLSPPQEVAVCNQVVGGFVGTPMTRLLEDAATLTIGRAGIIENEIELTRNARTIRRNTSFKSKSGCLNYSILAFVFAYFYKKNA